MSRLVLALGGNALGNNPQEQLELVKQTASSIVDLVADGHELIVTHGNGPQVGVIKSATDFAANKGAQTPEIPLPECGAMSQGYIGYHLQQAVQSELIKRGIQKSCVSLVTQTLVDKNDPAFNDPSKPVGVFLTEEQAKAKAQETGYCYKEDAGRGWRQVVASPLPKEIIEFDAIKTLIDAGVLVISTGGGGVPVIEKDGSYQGIPAVIDKDRSAALMAAAFKADTLVILTAVEKVAIHYNTEQQQDLSSLSLKEAQDYIKEGHFAPGSMLPKIEACLSFIESYPQGKALITSLEAAAAGLKGETGTIIHA